MEDMLYKESLKNITAVKILDEGLLLEGKTSWKITDDHDQECCESVYADWSILELYKKPLEKIRGGVYVRIKGVADEGFLLCFNSLKVFIPCYNDQSGYYSNKLSLEIEHSGQRTSIDITECEDD